MHYKYSHKTDQLYSLSPMLISDFGCSFSILLQPAAQLQLQHICNSAT